MQKDSSAVLKACQKCTLNHAILEQPKKQSNQGWQPNPLNNKTSSNFNANGNLNKISTSSNTSVSAVRYLWLTKRNRPGSTNLSPTQWPDINNRLTLIEESIFSMKIQKTYSQTFKERSALCHRNLKSRTKSLSCSRKFKKLRLVSRKSRRNSWLSDNSYLSGGWVLYKLFGSPLIQNLENADAALSKRSKRAVIVHCRSIYHGLFHLAIKRYKTAKNDSVEWSSATSRWIALVTIHTNMDT